MENMFELVKKNIPNGKDIIVETIDAITSGKNTAYIKDNFSEMVVQTSEQAYETYQKKEKSAWKHAIKEYVENELDEYDKESTISFLQENFDTFDDFFLSLTQSRKSRAGSGFEDIIKILFKKLKYPFSEQCVIDGKPDFILPSKEYYDRNPPDCIIFTAKRTVRERWRQIVTEGTRGRGFFLATLDDKISSKQLKDMLANRIYLVVPKDVKNTNEEYTKAVNVIIFEEFFTDHLDPAMERWKKARVIP